MQDKDCPRSLVETCKKLVESLEKRGGFCQLECDGASRVIAHYLTELGISFDAFKGYVSAIQPIPRLLVDPHFWIRLRDESGELWIIDCKLNMWIGADCALKDKVPSGVFQLKQAELHQIRYVQDAIVDFGRQHPAVVVALIDRPIDLDE